MARATGSGCGPFFLPCYAAPTVSLRAACARATVLARDWDRGARRPTAAFRRLTAHRRFVLSAGCQPLPRPDARGRPADPSTRRGALGGVEGRLDSVFLLSLVSYRPASFAWLLDPQLIRATAAAGLDKRRKNEATTRRRCVLQPCGCARRRQASHCCTWDCSHAADATRFAGRRRGSRC